MADAMTCTISFTDVPTIFAVPAIEMCDVCPEDKLVPARMAVATADAEAPVGRAVPSDPAVIALCVVENVCEPKLKFELLKTNFLGPSSNTMGAPVVPIGTVREAELPLEMVAEEPLRTME